MFISLIGSWTQTVAQSWLVFQLTNSAFLLGVVGFLSSIPIFLLSLFGGVIADRINKRSILIFTQNAFMLLAFALAILIQTNLIQTWQIMLIALLNGVIMAFDAPSRQALVVELVGKKYLMNAIALNSLAFNSSRIIGPALAAILVASIGMSGCFYLNGVSFIAAIFVLYLIRKSVFSVKKPEGTFLKDMLEGLRFIKDNRLILILVSMVGVLSLFGISYVITMPVFAKDVLNLDIKGFGFLMSATGIGAVAAALILAGLGDFKYKGRLLFVSLMVFSLALTLLSFSRNSIAAIIILVFLGWGSVSATALINTILQHLVPDAVRGRVMSVFMFTFAGVMPFGNLIAGALSQAWGVSLAMMSGGLICAVFSIVISLLFPEVIEI